MAIEADIMAALTARIETVSAVQKIFNDRIYLSIADIRDFELPAVQIWDIAQAIQHHRGRIEVNWSISVEIIMRSLETGAVVQSDLWNLRHEIQRAIWSEPNLGVPGVKHLIYTGNVTDLHLLEPNYIARIDLDVLFYDDLTGSC